MTFEQLMALFRAEHLDESAAEVHGILCGRLAGGERLDGDRLLPAMFASLGCEEETLEHLLAPLDELYSQSLEELDRGSMEFQPLLPGENVEIGSRVAALGEWCRGFLSGLGDAGLSADGAMTDEIAECLNDLLAITQAEVDAADEQSERDFMELAEYVRVAAMLVFTEINGAENDTNRTLH